MNRSRTTISLVAMGVFAVHHLGTFAADDFHLHRFHRLVLTDTYYSEGIGAGDLDTWVGRSCDGSAGHRPHSNIKSD